MDARDLDALLLQNVVRVRFIKKTTGTRRTMLCTKSVKLLTSRYGKTVLRFRTPKHRARYEPFSRNQTIVWDMEKRDYRIITCDAAMPVEVTKIEDFMRMHHIR